MLHEIKTKRGRYRVGYYCAKCEKNFSKQEGNFYYRKDTNKYRKTCISCWRKQGKKYKEENKAEALEYSREYYWKNRETILEKLGKKDRSKYYQEYCQNNKDYFTIKRLKDVSNKRGVKMDYSEDMWNISILKFGEECAYCGGDSGDSLITVDHIIPISKGGDSVDHNLVPACWECNRFKSSKDFGEWYRNWKFFDNERYTNLINHINANNRKEVLK